MQLPSPKQIKSEYPLPPECKVPLWRLKAVEVLTRKDPRLALIVGPCSIHDRDAALEYATHLKNLSDEIDELFFPIMRLFIEKPRTTIGWKGMVYDPFLDGSNDLAAGIRKCRELMVQITELGVPCAAELLDPLIAPYFDDLLVWGLIGARTSASQPHRQMASGLGFPVGFKNDFRGDVDVAIASLLAARVPHSHIGIDELGHVAAIETRGNPLTHLVLRGSDTQTNYDPSSLQLAVRKLEESRLEPRLLVDCSHGNCGKEYNRQKLAFESVMHQAKENRAIAGLMLESHLFSGKQPLTDDPKHLKYGVSITDPCLGWDETAHLLREAAYKTRFASQVR